MEMKLLGNDTSWLTRIWICEERYNRCWTQIIGASPGAHDLNFCTPKFW